VRNGFTLIEVVIVMAIVGILAAIALPSYTVYLERSKRVVAQGQLLEEAQHLERHFMKNGSYMEAALTVTQSPPFGAAAYELSFEARTANSYTLSATPVGQQRNDSCGALSLTQAGERSPASCWN